jgi:hypothetical protein
VHAESSDGDYLTRATTGGDGTYQLHVPAAGTVQLTAYRRGDAVVGPVAREPAQLTADFALAPTGTIHVTPSVPGHFGEPGVTGGRLHVEYPIDGDVTLTAPVGDWEVVVSRGYEYEVYRETVAVSVGATVDVAATLEHVVDTTGVMCADYHIHTVRSADSGDDVFMKVRSAVADGLELPIRSEHEFAAGFQSEIEQLGVEQWAYGVPSVEMTSMEIWGHFGVLPILPNDDKINDDTPLWQRYPSAEEPDIMLETLQPPELFAAVRARPEQPVIIINHPRGGTNYFEFAAYDPVTGLPGYPEFWDEQFPLVEVFNDASWRETFDRTVVDWLSFLDNGRRVFAVGSSDSHGITRSPVGYPRTCLELGTDDPTTLSWDLVRDVTAAGHSTISGGIYVDATVGSAGPGDDATGLGATALVRVRIQAASWIDVDAIDIVVDGQIVSTIDVLPEDADAGNPVIRYDKDVQIDVAPGTGGYVIVAAYGNSTLEPVHPGRIPFGVANPIFVSR